MNAADSIVLDRGFTVNNDEGYRKLICRQFADEPARAFCELIQNAVDSHPSTISFRDRYIWIESSSPNKLSIRDVGSGLNVDRISLLLTMGGTDKDSDLANKLGRFGIGFFSVFNPKLSTKKVMITTNCDGELVQITLTVVNPGHRPKIDIQVHGTASMKGTTIEIEFSKIQSVSQCLSYAKKYLYYFPCPAMINKEPVPSIWRKGHEKPSYFSEGYCEGFIEKKTTNWSQLSEITLLSKFEYLGFTTLNRFVGGRNVNKDLRDLYVKDVPYIPGLAMLVNCNNLNLTISRDGWYLDSAYDNMVKTIAKALALHLEASFDKYDEQTILANLFIYRNQLRDYLSESKRSSNEDRLTNLICRLAEVPVFKIANYKEKWSFLDIKTRLSSNLPLFYSCRHDNSWLGGDFKHDFVVYPAQCHVGGGAPDFYESLFGCIFPENVNLDTVMNDQQKLSKLIHSGIINQESLSPRYQIEKNNLTEPEIKLLKEIESILSYPPIVDAIARHLYLKAGAVKPILFSVEDRKFTISTGLFDNEDKVLSNIEKEDTSLNSDFDTPHKIIYLGIRRNHPIIEHLIASEDPNRIYYAMIFLVHQLAVCQKLLVPHSSFFNMVKEALCRDVRRALFVKLTSASS
jgi:hypothetical protein